MKIIGYIWGTINFFPSLLYHGNMFSFPSWNVSKATWVIFIFSASWRNRNIDSYLHRGIGGKGWQALLFPRDELLLQLLMTVKITSAGWSLTVFWYVHNLNFISIYQPVSINDIILTITFSFYWFNTFTKWNLDYSTHSLKKILSISKVYPRDMNVTQLKYSWKICENAVLTYRLIQSISEKTY